MTRPPFLLRFLAVALLAVTGARALTVGDLRVESLDRPLGIDTARPRLGWVLHSNQRAQRQTAYQVRIASSPGMLAADRGDVWDSGRVARADNFGIEYAGPLLRSATRYFWQVRVWDQNDRASAWSEPSFWQMGLLSPSDWSAKWIGGGEAGSPLLRREFSIERKVVRATAYAYATGWYRLLVNGTEITERVLAPVNSNYPKGLFYDAYDVTSLVQTGANAVGLWLGWGYNQSYSKYGYRWDAPPAGLLQLEIAFSDGTSRTIVTDGTWKWTDSPIIANDIYHGETHDARRELAGWSRAGFEDHAWQPVTLRAAPPGPLISCPFPGLTITTELRPVKLTEPRPGVFVFDLGQNIAGWVRLKVRGDAGQQVVMRHAEELHPDGTLDTATNRAARATDIYILAGRGDETYEPRFTYHGFRYVEVSGFPGKPTLESLTGCAVSANLGDAGTFSCSDPVLNRLHSNFRWSIANNLVGIPTDTASRDERTPCQMDSLAVEDAAIANFGMAGYYSKWLHDIAGDGGSLPNWTGDQVVLPFLLYQNYGDRRILEQHFDNMKQVVDRFTATAKENKHWAGGYGDWCAPNKEGSYEGAFSEGELVGRAFHIRCARIVASVASVLGHKEDHSRYTALSLQLSEEFRQRYRRPGTPDGRQITFVLPLAFGIPASNNNEREVAALRRRIVEKDGSHLDTGIFGTRYLFEVLMDHGHTELAYQILTAPGYPGYVDQIAQGATTTWEQWTYRGSMQTHDHAMFAGPDATFFTHLGGIRAGLPGFRHIEIQPVMPSALSWVECSRETPMGRVATRWERTSDRLLLKVTIPANASALIRLPAPDATAIMESGQPAARSKGVLVGRTEAGHTKLDVGSGTYEFSVPLPSSATKPLTP